MLRTVVYFCFIRCFCSHFSHSVLSENVSEINNYDNTEISTVKLESSHERLDESTKDIINKVIARKCAHDYSNSCFKIDIAKFVNKLGSQNNYQLLPGVSLVRSASTSWNQSDIPMEIAMSIVRNNSISNELDSYLFSRMDQYLNSLSVKVNLIENPIVSGLKGFGSQLITGMLRIPAALTTGRSKKGHKHDMHAAVWSAATMAALGFAGLAAMSGKAMMTATLALILSIMCLLKGCGHGHGKSSHYEIITKPAHLHDVDHLHSLSSPYGYARHFVEEGIIPALGHLDPTHEDESQNVQTKVVPMRAIHLQPSRNYMPTDDDSYS